MSIYQFLAAKPQFATLAVVGEPDLVLEGRHCSVACYLQSKESSKEGLSKESKEQLSEESDNEQWHFSPSCIPVGSTFSSDSDEEWIANSISYMPNIDFFVNFNSFDQVKHWIACRDNAVELALCFGDDGDFLWLKSELDSGRIDQFSYNYSLAEAKIFKNLWNLIKVNESDIRRIFKKKWGFPFDSVRSLFVEVVREDLEDEFSNCLKRRYVYNASHIKKIAILKRKVHQEKASSKEVKELYSLIDRNRSFAIWLDRLLTVAILLSNRSPLVKQYLENYWEGLDDLAKLQIQRDCDPELRHHRIPSHSWNLGQYRESVLPWDYNRKPRKDYNRKSRKG